MATGQRTQSQSEDGCGLFCGRLPNNRESTMNKRINPSTRVGDQGCLPPVRVKLLRRDAYAEQTAPPDGEGEDWGSRLNKALGTVSTDFVRASLLQVQGAARSPFGTISETAINAALAMIEAVAPKDELEGALAVQMACTHAAAMSVLVKMDSGFGTERRIAAFGSTAARLMKAYTMQLEVLRRLRTGGQQLVRVEHVHINDGGHAAIGNVMVSDAASTDGKNSEPVRQSSGQPTTNKRSNPPMPVAGQRRLPPVRVKLLRDGDDNLTVTDE